MELLSITAGTMLLIAVLAQVWKAQVVRKRESWKWTTMAVVGVLSLIGAVIITEDPFGSMEGIQRLVQQVLQLFATSFVYDLTKTLQKGTVVKDEDQA